MELFVISMAVVGLATTITAIDEFIDWLPSYRRAAEEMRDEDNLHTTYDEICEQGYRE